MERKMHFPSFYPACAACALWVQRNNSRRAGVETKKSTAVVCVRVDYDQKQISSQPVSRAQQYSSRAAVGRIKNTVNLDA